ncbi:MAG: hypothetical protein M0C28_31685 [Candidatus Moduliflexus flocculans]|nr:hypothetical protein [Candidatus Moduliflexus flocculans]
MVKATKIVSIGNKSRHRRGGHDRILTDGRPQDRGHRHVPREHQERAQVHGDRASKVKQAHPRLQGGPDHGGRRVPPMSHTAGMANNDVIFDSACSQAGIIRVEVHHPSSTRCRRCSPTCRPLEGKRIAVFTNSGAFGGITADLLIEAGLEMARLSPETQEKLAKTGQIFNVSQPHRPGTGAVHADVPGDLRHPALLRRGGRTACPYRASGTPW